MLVAEAVKYEMKLKFNIKILIFIHICLAKRNELRMDTISLSAYFYATQESQKCGWSENESYFTFNHKIIP